MKYEEACQLFGIDDEITEAEIKTRYKQLSLKYHPDKNTSPDACYQFQLVHEAYRILLETGNTCICEDSDEGGNEDWESEDWDAGTNVFINPIWESIYNYVLELYHSNTWNIIESMDKTVLLKLYGFLCKHRGRFSKWGDVIVHHLGLLLKITLKPEESLSSKVKNYIIYPKLEDLLACNLYKHVEPGIDGTGEPRTFLVPCWMEESVFDDGKDEIVIHCIPVFPKGCWMDDNHNIHQFVEYTISDAWNIPDDGQLNVRIGERIYPVNKTELRMLKTQTIVRRCCGVPIGNTSDVFDVSKRGNVIIHIHIE